MEPLESTKPSLLIEPIWNSETTAMPARSLAVEIFIKIFSYLNDIRDIQSASLVHPTWRNVLVSEELSLKELSSQIVMQRSWIEGIIICLEQMQEDSCKRVVAQLQTMQESALTTPTIPSFQSLYSQKITLVTLLSEIDPKTLEEIIVTLLASMLRDLPSSKDNPLAKNYDGIISSELFEGGLWIPIKTRAEENNDLSLARSISTNPEFTTITLLFRTARAWHEINKDPTSEIPILKELLDKQWIGLAVRLVKQKKQKPQTHDVKKIIKHLQSKGKKNLADSVAQSFGYDAGPDYKVLSQFLSQGGSIEELFFQAYKFKKPHLKEYVLQRNYEFLFNRGDLVGARKIADAMGKNFYQLFGQFIKQGKKDDAIELLPKIGRSKLIDAISAIKVTSVEEVDKILKITGNTAEVKKKAVLDLCASLYRTTQIKDKVMELIPRFYQDENDGARVLILAELAKIAGNRRLREDTIFFLKAISDEHKDIKMNILSNIPFDMNL